MDRSGHAGICMKVAQVEASESIYNKRYTVEVLHTSFLLDWLGYEKPTRSLTFRLLPCMVIDAWLKAAS